MILILLFFHFSQMKVILHPVKIEVHVSHELLCLLFITVVQKMLDMYSNSAMITSLNSFNFYEKD